MMIHDDCYFCCKRIGSFNKKNKGHIKYAYFVSAPKPVPHDNENPVPTPPADQNRSAVVKRIVMMNLLKPTLKNHTF